MEKTLIINMDYVAINGDVLDVTSDKAGIIYNVSKDVIDEISVDYVDENNKDILLKRRYDICTFFFNLNEVWSNRKRECIIKEASQYLKKDGKIYLWDINKERGKIVNSKVKIKMPNKTFKETDVINLNPLIEFNYKDVEKILSKYFVINEEKVWEDMFYIKATRKL